MRNHDAESSASRAATAGPLIAIVAGEASGDFLGSELMLALRASVPNVRFAGIGGPRMQAAGLDSWYPMERLAVRGYIEVLRQLPGLLAMRRRLARRIKDANPACFIGIDAPDFNLSLERNLRLSGLRTVHYVSPSIWAWRGERMRRIAAAVDHMLVLFPFEAALYENAGVSVTYVGHPLADAIPSDDTGAKAREQLKIPAWKRVFALLPGSRQSEVRYMADTFIRTAQHLARREPEAQFLVPLASRETREIFEAALYANGAQDLPMTILFGHAREALGAADAVLVASGTATLETALLQRPMVITYRMSGATWKMMSRRRYQPWVGLPNIIAGEFIVPEILQEDATPENLAQALSNVATDPAIRERLPAKFAEMHGILRRGASQRAAQAVAAWIS